MLARKYEQVEDDDILNAKRMRCNEDKTMDPLELLPEPCFYRVMQNLPGKELLQAMEVSKSWKQYIETTASLYERAMNQVVFNPNVPTFVGQVTP